MGGRLRRTSAVNYVHSGPCTLTLLYSMETEGKNLLKMNKLTFVTHFILSNPYEYTPNRGLNLYWKCHYIVVRDIEPYACTKQISTWRVKTRTPVFRNPVRTIPPLKFYYSYNCNQRLVTVLLLMTLCSLKRVLQGSIISDIIYLPRRNVNIWKALEHTRMVQQLGTEYHRQTV